MMTNPKPKPPPTPQFTLEKAETGICVETFCSTNGVIRCAKIRVGSRIAYVPDGYWYLNPGDKVVLIPIKEK